MNDQQDWLMRQIRALAEVLLSLITGKKIAKEIISESMQSSSETNPLYIRIHELVRRERLCEAEDILWEALEQNNDRQAVEAAVLFYCEINELSDEELTKGNFTRDEILQGIKQFRNRYGIDDDMFGGD